MSFLRDTAQSAGAALILTGARFVALAIIARKLEVELFGTLAFSIFCLDLVVLSCLIGLPGVITRYLPIASGEGLGRFSRLRRNWLALSLPLLVGVAPLVGWGLIGLNGNALLLFCGWAALTALQNVALAQMQGAMRYDRVAWSGALGALVLILGSTFGVAQGELNAAMAVLALAAAVQIIPLVGLPFRKEGASEREIFPDNRRILTYGANSWLAALTSTLVWSRGELLIIESLLDDRALGLYGAAVTLTGLVWRLTGLMQGAVAQYLAQRLDDRAALTGFVRDVNRLTLMMSAGFALAIALMGSEIAALVFGSSFAPAGWIMAMLAPGAAVAGIGTVNLTVQYLSNAVVTRNALIVASVFLPAIAWVLIHPYGAEGGAFARTLTLVLLATAMPVWMMLRGYGALGRSVLGELGVIVVLISAASLLAMTGWAPLPVRFVLWLAGSYGFAIWATGQVHPKAMLRSAHQKLRAI